MTSEFLQGIADAYRTTAGPEGERVPGDPRATVTELIELVGHARERVGGLALERERLQAERDDLRARHATLEAERDELRAELHALGLRLEELNRCGEGLREALAAAEAAGPAMLQHTPATPDPPETDADVSDPAASDAGQGEGPLRSGELRRSLAGAFRSGTGRRRSALSPLLGEG